MANRSHSEVENSGNGRHLSITSVQELLNTFKDNLSEHLTEDNIVKINLDPVTNLIFKTYFKWFPYIITDDTKIKIKENFVHIFYNDNNIEINFNDQIFSIPIESSLKDQYIPEYKSLARKFLSTSNFYGIDCQSSNSFTDKLNAILVMRESHLHNSEYFKDCIITTNNTDIETIRALEQTNTVSLPVNCVDNKLDIDSIKNHCEVSDEFIAGIIIPEEVEVNKKIIKAIHDIDGYVYKQCSYKELLNASDYESMGVDIIGFGPIATTEELSVFLPCSEETGTSLSYGRLYTTPANSISVEILKTLVADV